jgi:hypothetical protein
MEGGIPEVDADRDHAHAEAMAKPLAEPAGKPLREGSDVSN